MGLAQQLLDWVTEHVFGLGDDLSTGIRVQKTELVRIHRKLQTYATVRMLTLSGVEIDEEFLRDFRGGPDGGIDLVLQVQCKTSTATRRMETRVLNIICKVDY